MALTPEQQGLLDDIVRVLEADPEIQAVWLGGSLGRGGGDAFSDVDVVIVVDDPVATGARYLDKIPEIAEPALITPMFGGQTINVVTAEWRRFDLDFAAPDSPKVGSPARTLVFDRNGRTRPAAEAKPYRTSPGALLKLVNEFIRVLGVGVVAIGREEWIMGLSGVDMLRRMTMDLMLEENGLSPFARGGMLHRGALLTPEQRAELEALTPVAATRDGVINGNRELAVIFLPRAKRLAADIGMAWPTAFEDATRAHVLRHLGYRIS